MKVVTEMPKSGQFVAVWEFQGNVWSDTYRYDEHGWLEQFVAANRGEDEYWTSEFGGWVDEINCQMFIVSEEV